MNRSRSPLRQWPRPVSAPHRKNRAQVRDRASPGAQHPEGSSRDYIPVVSGRVPWWGGTLPSAHMQPKVTRAGDRGLLADFGVDVAAAELHARATALRERRNVVACIVGQQSLYVVFEGEPAVDFDEVPSIAFTPRTHVIDVDFSGVDLDEFLAHAHVTRDDFLKRVPSIRLTARYLGFRAGFAYLEGWPDEWRMPRRPTSRNLVPRGSFAIAGAMAGFYPVDSPGGWNLLGRTNATLWDPNAEPPNRFAPGDVVTLRATSIDHFDAPPADRVVAS